jgi:oxygen-independent coproporphyrinogen III oxidase
MAGVYIHIPFCKKACHYCDFHFSTSLKMKNEMVEALKQEIRLQRDYFSVNSYPLNTIYFGGGTPSLLSTEEITGLIEEVKSVFAVSEGAEITLEANPDDLTQQKIKELSLSPVNRLSIGIQSFRDSDLALMNRAHTADIAKFSVKQAQEAGFDNITIDLIYGIPGLSKEEWQENLNKAFSLNVPHISAYALTIEPKTAFSSFIQKGKMATPDEEATSRHFELMLDKMDENGYLQYEISNFCRDGWHSRHNSSYWSGEQYLGIGPSAHSFNGKSRQWNVSNNALYLRGLKEGVIPFEKEEISKRTAYNEYVLTTLRTSAGINLAKVEELGQDFLEHLLNENRIYENKGYTLNNQNQITLSREGKLFADAIASGFFLV